MVPLENCEISGIAWMVAMVTKTLGKLKFNFEVNGESLLCLSCSKAEAGIIVITPNLEILEIEGFEELTGLKTKFTTRISEIRFTSDSNVEYQLKLQPQKKS